MQDRTEMFVSPDEGAKIRAALTKSTEGFVTVRGTTIKKTAIVKLEEGGTDPRVSIFHTPEERAKLTAGSCRGEKSIAKELMKIAGKQKNFKLLADKKWREEQKKILHETGKWCDTEAGTCACQPT